MFGKWVYCKLGGDSNAESASKWNRMYLLLNEKGTLSLFEDEATNAAKGSFDLTLWTLPQIVESKNATEFGTFQVSMRSEEGDIQFVFQNEVERRGMVNAMKQFIGVEDEDSEEIEEEKKSNGMYLEGQCQCNVVCLHKH